MYPLYYYIIAATVVAFTPILRTLFCSFHTMIHETGHAFAALLTSGKVYKISLFASTEGVAYTAYRSTFSGVIIYYFGYTFATMAAVFSFYLIINGELSLLYYSFIIIAVLNLLFWVRNLYGVFWLLLFLGAAFCLEYYQLNYVREVFILFFASILLVQSFLSSFQILVLSITNPRHAGDTTGLRDLTYIPAFLWGILFFSQSVAGVYFLIQFVA